MRIQILSDLHLEFSDYKPKDLNADIILLAGDINIGVKGIQWAIDNFNNIPVIYILGNHEYYKNSIPSLLNKLKEKAKGTNVIIMENESFQFEDIRFLGCTLWTDLALFENNAFIGAAIASSTMSDYSMIRVSPNYRKLNPNDTIRSHKQSIKWLDTQFSSRSIKTVVITHHAPSQLSLNPAFNDLRENASFASNLENDILKWAPVIWVHGHIHKFSDYNIDKTRVICNPRGYPGENDTNFKEDFVIEIN